MANETLTSVFSDIADAIRAKGVSGQMMPTEMPTKITSIPSGGSGSKYGVSLDGIIGDVNEEGILQYPNQTFTFSTGEIKRIPINILYQFFTKFTKSNLLTEINLPNLEEVESNKLFSAQVHGGMALCCYGCTGLTSVSMPKLSSTGTNNYSSVEYSGALEKCFGGCTSLVSVDMSGLTDITSKGLGNCFLGCTSLINVNLQSISTISGNSGAGGMLKCFSGCTSLQTINLSGNKTYIGQDAFSLCFNGCTSLRVVDMSNWGNPFLHSSGFFYGTFRDCTSLEVVNFDGIQSIPNIETNTFQNTNSTFQIVVPDALYDTWIAATNWSTYASQIVKASEYTPAS